MVNVMKIVSFKFTSDLCARLILYVQTKNMIHGTRPLQNSVGHFIREIKLRTDTEVFELFVTVEDRRNWETH